MTRESRHLSPPPDLERAGPTSECSIDLGFAWDAPLAAAVKAFCKTPTLRIRDVGRCEVLRPEHLGTEGFAWLDEASSVFEEVDRKFRWRPRCVRRGGVYITRQGDAVYVQGLFREALLPRTSALPLGVPGHERGGFPTQPRPRRNFVASSTSCETLVCSGP